MKIAVPVDTDKETIFKRTGHAPFFALYEDENLLSVVDNHHGKGEHGAHENHEHDEHESDEDHVAHHKKDISALQGCDVILVQAVGEHMQEALDSLNIKIKKIRKKDGLTANEAVQNFLNNNL